MSKRTVHEALRALFDDEADLVDDYGALTDEVETMAEWAAISPRHHQVEAARTHVRAREAPHPVAREMFQRISCVYYAAARVKLGIDDSEDTKAMSRLHEQVEYVVEAEGKVVARYEFEVRVDGTDCATGVCIGRGPDQTAALANLERVVYDLISELRHVVRPEG